MKGLCLIISGGEFSEISNELCAAEYIIACDRGWQYAERMGISPNLIVGDFDSAPFPETTAFVKRVPTHKDDTDTMLAARHAIELGFRDIAICCAFGGRFDHSLANIQTAAFIAAQGGQSRLIGVNTDAFVFTNGSRQFARRDGWSLSVFSLSDRCKGVSIRGTKFECQNEELTNAFPLGVSNVWTSRNAEISLRQGILLVLQSKLEKGEHI